jgi:hypothetical protein
MDMEIRWRINAYNADTEFEAGPVSVCHDDNVRLHITGCA